MPIVEGDMEPTQDFVADQAGAARGAKRMGEGEGVEQQRIGAGPRMVRNSCPRPTQPITSSRSRDSASRSSSIASCDPLSTNTSRSTAGWPPTPSLTRMWGVCLISVNGTAWPTGW